MLFPNLFALLYLWTQRYRQRRRLRFLAPWQLNDLGLTVAEAAHEADKPCWRA